MGESEQFGKAQQSCRQAFDAISDVESELPSFRSLVADFSTLLKDFLAANDFCTEGLAALSQSLYSHMAKISAKRGQISAYVADARRSIALLKQHTNAADDGRAAFEELHRLNGLLFKGISGVEQIVAEVEDVVESQANVVIELAIRYDMPPETLKLARALIDRTKS